MKKELIQQIKDAKTILLNHGVVAFPTETVMGLGVLFNDYDAYIRLNVIKERPEDKPYTMMVKDVDEIEKYAFVDKKISRVINRFMPGSITLLLKAKECVPGYVTHNTGVIGIRVPTNEEAVALLKEINVPLLVPSANKSGEKPAQSSEEARRIFGEEVTYIDGCSTSNVPSTIVDLSANDIKLIRKGPISFDGIRAIYNGNKFEETVNCYLLKDDEILMLYRNKKEVDINKGKWIGVGGHIEQGETPLEAVIREVREETSLKVNSCKLRAKITFCFKDDVEEMYTYTSDDFSGEVDFDCNEGTLKWIKKGELFNLPVWEGDKLFIEPILNNENYFEITMRYEGDILKEYKKVL